MSEKKRAGIVLIPLLMMAPITAKANMIWPSLYIVEGMYTWYVIALGLVVELFFVKFMGKQTWWKAGIIAFVMNLISALLGVILVPVSGIVVELLLTPFSALIFLLDNDTLLTYFGGTFSLSHWIFAYVAAIVCNAIVEGLVMKWVFKFQWKKVFKWLCIANSISVILSGIVLAINGIEY